MKSNGEYRRVSKNSFDMDGLITSHNHRFIDERGFSRAYQRATQASGRDYGIPWRTHVFLWAGELARKRAKKDDIFVELGTGRGWMMSALLEYLDPAHLPKEVYLFDSFESTVIDKVTGKNIEDGAVHPYYATSFADVEENFSQWEGVKLVRGWLPKTLDCIIDKEIAFIHLDLNHAKTEVSCLKQLWPAIIRGGVVVLDDYAYRGHEDQYLALNDLSHKLDVDILSLPTGQGLLIKP